MLKLRHPFFKLFSGTLCSRILGLIRDSVFFAILGSSIEASAFLIAFAIPNLFRRLCGEGALNSAFIPVFAQKTIQSSSAANHFLNVFFSRINIYLGSFVLVSIGLLIFLQSNICDLKWYTATHLTWIMLPYLWFICLAALYNGALNVHNAFSLTSFSPVLLNIVMLLGLFIGSFFYSTQKQILAVSLCVLLGGFLQWFLPRLQLRHVCQWKPTFVWEKNEDLTRIWDLFVPSIFGVAIYQINILLGRLLAYIIDERGVSFLYLSNRFLELPLGLFAFSIIAVLLPKLSLAEAKKNLNEARKILNHSIDFLMTLLLPASCGLFLLAQPMLQVFFCWGKFTLEDVQSATTLLEIFAVGLPFFALTSLLVRIFYAHRDTQTPVKVSCVILFIYLLLAILGIPFFKVSSLALASTISSFCQFILLWKIVKQRYPHYQLQFHKYCTRKIIALAAMIIWVIMCRPVIFTSENRWIFALLLGLVIVSAAIIYTAILLVCDRNNCKQLWQTLHKA